MESILLNTMYDLPGFEGVEEVAVNGEVVDRRSDPLYIFSDRHDEVESSA